MYYWFAKPVEMLLSASTWQRSCEAAMLVSLMFAAKNLTSTKINLLAMQTMYYSLHPTEREYGIIEFFGRGVLLRICPSHAPLLFNLNV